MSLDLWPDGVGVTELRSPVGVLRQQALLLGQKTDGKVCAVVLPVDPQRRKKGEYSLFVADGAKMAYSFSLVAPSLGGNAFNIFTISHGLELYPVRFAFERNALKLDVMFDQTLLADAISANDEIELIYCFRKIFHSRIMKQNIQGLLAQSQAIGILEEQNESNKN